MKPNVPKKLHMYYVETARQKVASVLFKYPEKEFSLSELAKEAGVAKAHIGRVLDEFYSFGLVKIVKLSKIWRIRANQESQDFIKSKIVYNLNLVYSSGLVEFLNEEFNNPKAIVLFGSFRKGDDISTSDIDIAIEIPENVPPIFKMDDEVAKFDFETVRPKESVEYEKFIGRKIQLHLFNRKNADLNVFNNIANGIVLSGFLEVKK